MLTLAKGFPKYSHFALKNGPGIPGFLSIHCLFLVVDQLGSSDNDFSDWLATRNPDVHNLNCWVSHMTSHMCLNRRKEAAERRRSRTLSDWGCWLINHTFNKTHLFHPAPIMEVVAHRFYLCWEEQMSSNERFWRSMTIFPVVHFF